MSFPLDRGFCACYTETLKRKWLTTVMRKIVDPRQISLVDPYAHVLSPLARKALDTGWQCVFRKVILDLMPATALADRFHESMGAPTKELYSVAGLMFIMEFQNWTVQQAVDAYMLDIGVHYALNLDPGGQSMSSRTVERYRQLFRELDLAAAVQERVTKALIEALELSVAKQRADSTHVFSDMAMFGRTQLMAVTVKRFLTQVLRHDREGYDALPEDLRARVRGKPAVFNAIRLKAARWNVMQAAKSKKMRELLAQPAKLETFRARLQGVLGRFCAFISYFISLHHPIRTMYRRFRGDITNCYEFPPQRLPLLSTLSLKGDQGGCSSMPGQHPTIC